MSEAEVEQVVESCVTVASLFSVLCSEYFNGVIRSSTVKHIQKTLARNMAAISN